MELTGQQVLHRREVERLLWQARKNIEAELQPASESPETPAVASPTEQSEPQQSEQSVPAMSAETEENVALDGFTSSESSDTLQLESPEVTEGLQQLLSEWDIFKGGGFLGFGGSNGIESPLYKKIAIEPMLYITSGRFDGSDKVIENIRNTINGWRREQHITPENGETFETYLRRVVRAILSQQPKPGMEARRS